MGFRSVVTPQLVYADARYEWNRYIEESRLFPPLSQMFFHADRDHA